jgi:hypothetical protein
MLPRFVTGRLCNIAQFQKNELSVPVSIVKEECAIVISFLNVFVPPGEIAGPDRCGPIQFGAVIAGASRDE